MCYSRLSVGLARQQHDHIPSRVSVHVVTYPITLVKEDLILQEHDQLVSENQPTEDKLLLAVKTITVVFIATIS